MNKNKCYFPWENKFYNVISEFIKNDKINFDEHYIEAMNFYHRTLNEYYCGGDFIIQPRFRRAGKKYNDCKCEHKNIGDVWEESVDYLVKDVRLPFNYESWPNGKSEFPDAKETTLDIDYKALNCDGVYTENNKRHYPVGMLKNTNGHNGLGTLTDEDFINAIKIYKQTGVLCEHLKSLIVMGVYQKTFNEFGQRVHKILNVIVAPAIFLVDFKKDGTLALRNKKVTISARQLNFEWACKTLEIK